MGKIPVLKPRDVISILHNLGFVLAWQRGSHKQYHHAGGQGTRVPDHQGREIQLKSSLKGFA